MIKNGFYWLLKRLPFYALFFIFPVLGMKNCEGWNEGSMTAKSCIIDNSFLHAYADFYYGLLLISSFTLLIPLLIYIAGSVWLAGVLGRKFND